MTTRFPQQNIWKQYNKSNRLGDLWASYNLDLSNNLGGLRVSPRFVLNSSSADDSNIGIPCAAKSFETSAGTPQKWWMLAGAHIFYSTGGLDGSLTLFTTPSTPDGSLDPDYSDMEVFNNELHIFDSTTTSNYIDSTGAGSGIANALITGAGLHSCCYFRAQNRLYIVDNSAKGISSMNTAHTPVLATSGSQYSINNLADANSSFITWIRSTGTRIWIGIMNLNGYGSELSWDGSQASGPNEVYQLESAGSFACVIRNDVPWIIDVEGRLLAFNGATFVEKDRLPFDHAIGKYLPYVYKATQRLVHYNGMCLDDGKIQIFVNAAPYDTSWPGGSVVNERVPSGIWEYTEETGLYHRRSLGLTKSGGTISDYGQQKIQYVGCLAFLKFSSLFLSAGSVKGSMLAGASVYTDATSTVTGVFYDDYANTLQKSGYFTTQKIFAPSIQDAWQRVAVRFKKLKNASDKIVVKYRSQEDTSTEATITWSSTTQFTSTADLSGFAVGDEVEVLQGIGAGKLSHITVISSNAGTYTVTVDETYTGATGTAKARFQTWKKLVSYSSQTDQVVETTVGVPSPWVQFRVWLINQGTDEFYDLTAFTKEYQ